MKNRARTSLASKVPLHRYVARTGSSAWALRGALIRALVATVSPISVAAALHGADAG